jgi:hypothetical protein
MASFGYRFTVIPWRDGAAIKAYHAAVTVIDYSL